VPEQKGVGKCQVKKEESKSGIYSVARTEVAKVGTGSHIKAEQQCITLLH
jgi:hypothetical protein